MDGWYYKLFDLVCGPESNDNLIELIKNGSLTGQDEVRFGERGQWRPIGSIGPLMTHLPFEEIDLYRAQAKQSAKTGTQLTDLADIASSPAEPSMRKTVDGVKSTAADRVWWCRNQSLQQFGPLKFSQLVEWAGNGRLLPDDQVKYDLDPYRSAREIQGLIFPERPAPEMIETQAMAAVPSATNVMSVQSLKPQPESPPKPGSSISPDATEASQNIGVLPQQSTVPANVKTASVSSVQDNAKSLKPKSGTNASLPITTSASTVPAAGSKPKTAPDVKTATVSDTAVVTAPIAVKPLTSAEAKRVPAAKPMVPAASSFSSPVTSTQSAVFTAPAVTYTPPKVSRPPVKSSDGINFKGMLPIGLGVVGVVLVCGLGYFAMQNLPANTANEKRRLSVLKEGYSDLVKIRDAGGKPSPEQLKAAREKLQTAAKSVIGELEKISKRTLPQSNLNKLARAMERVAAETSVSDTRSRPEFEVNGQLLALETLLGPKK